MLPDLEAAQIISGSRIERPAKKTGKTSDFTQIIALRLVPEMAKVHVVDKALAQRADHWIVRMIVHDQASC